MSNDNPLPDVEDQTIGQVLAETAGKYSNQDAIVFTALGTKLTWKEFYQKVTIAAKGLLSLKIQQGDHVAIWATNVEEWVILQMATARIGAVLVTINPAYRPFELKYVLKQSDCVALFLLDEFKTSNYFEMLKEVCPELENSKPGESLGENFPLLRWIVTLRGESLTGSITWNEMNQQGKVISDEQLTEAESNLSPSDPINIQYTSGTTGFPKAATLTHRNLLLNAFYIGDCQHITSDDRICIPVPFYHCFGCVLGTLCAAVYGSAMIIPNEYFTAESTLHAIETEKATSIYGVPTMFISMLDRLEKHPHQLTSLRTGIMAGSPCPIEVMRKVIDKLGANEITIAYGQTEASPVITQTRTDDPIELRVETVGRPLPGVEVKIIDPATGETLPDNTQGELCARGHVVMLGYYNAPEATAEAIDEEGWLHTGDLAIRKSNGYYRITGRIKEMVIRGGENIYPREIEEFLFTHPAIEQASVVGVPDKKYGEELAVWVRLKADAKLSADELQAFCRSNLAHYKVPRYVRFVESFPQTVTGKIQKFKIRETMIQDFNLEEQETA